MRLLALLLAIAAVATLAAVVSVLLHAREADVISAPVAEGAPSIIDVDFRDPATYRIIPRYLDVNVGDVVSVQKSNGERIPVRVLEVRAVSRWSARPRTRIALDIGGEEHFAYCGMPVSREGGIRPIEVNGIKIGIEITQLVFSSIGRGASPYNRYRNFRLSKDLRLAIWETTRPILAGRPSGFVVDQPAWGRDRYGNWLHGTGYGLHGAIDIFATRQGEPEQVRSPVEGIVYRVYNKDAHANSRTRVKAINLYADDAVGPNGEKMLLRLMHFSEILVSNGDHVRTGQVLGLIGHTGFDPAIGDHVHFEIRLNPSCFGLPRDDSVLASIPVNPYPYLLEWWADGQGHASRSRP